MRKLQLAPDNRKTVQQPIDGLGTVVVKLYLCDKGHKPVKGNISRSIRFTGKVSEVYDAIYSISEEPK